MALGPQDSLCVRLSESSAHVVVDVNGWFGGTTGIHYGARTQRIADSRNGLGGWSGTFAPGETRTLNPESQLPAGSTVAVLGVVSTVSSTAGFITVQPCGGQAEVSNLNFVRGQTVPNLVNRFVIGSSDLPGNIAWNNPGTCSTETANKVPAYRNMDVASAGSHTHTLGATALSIAQMPAHKHTFTGTTSDNVIGRMTANGTYSVNSVADGPFGQVAMQVVGSGATHNHSITSDGVHLHTYPAKPDNVPYWALCYMMKVK